MGTVYDIIGIIGVISILAAYYLLQKDVLAAHKLSYLSLNLAGAILIMISLLHAWNLSAFVVEAAWAVISVYGIFKALRNKTYS